MGVGTNGECQMRYLVNNQPADEFGAKRHFEQWFLKLGKGDTVREVLSDWDVAVQLFTMAVSQEKAGPVAHHYAQEFLKLSGVEIRQ